jgi:LPS sulfotransferase NodH
MAAAWDQFGEDYDQPPFEGAPRTYLIASSPRSGSHFLGHLLLETGALGSPLEYFEGTHLHKWMALLGTKDFRTTMACIRARRTSPTGWFGAKAHWGQFAPIANSETLLRFLDISKYIVIRRRDLTAQAISFVIARQTQSWISFHDSKIEPHYDFAAIRSAMTWMEQDANSWADFFHAHAIAPLVVDYEDLVADPETAVDRILAHCGANRRGHAPPRWQPQRQASDVNARWQDLYRRDLAAMGR